MNFFLQKTSLFTTYLHEHKYFIIFAFHPMTKRQTIIMCHLKLCSFFSDYTLKNRTQAVQLLVGTVKKTIQTTVVESICLAGVADLLLYSVVYRVSSLWSIIKKKKKEKVTDNNTVVANLLIDNSKLLQKYYKTSNGKRRPLSTDS